MVIGIAAASDEGLEPAEPIEEAVQPPATRTGPPVPGPLAIALAIIMVLSVATAFFGAFAFGLSGLQEQRSQDQLYAAFRGLLDPSSPIAPYIGGAISQGAPVALLDSPQAGLHNVMVVEGPSSGDLLAGPGHLADTPLPGQPGESVLVGKSSTAGAPFSGITRLRKGDLITVRTGQGQFLFTVLGRVLPGQRLPKITSAQGLLTLVTSAGPGTLGSLAPDHLMYVDAKLQGKAVPAPPGRPTTIPAVQVQGHNDPNAWPFAALWLLVLLAGSAACWWLWARWGIFRTWLVGAPVLFGILWVLSNETMRLLPNVY
jgi:sortase A